MLRLTVANAILNGEQPVKVWREHRGLMQEALTEKAGISKAYLCQIETRKHVGALKTLKAIAGTLAVSMNELHENLAKRGSPHPLEIWPFSGSTVAIGVIPPPDSVCCGHGSNDRPQGQRLATP